MERLLRNLPDPEDLPKKDLEKILSGVLESLYVWRDYYGFLHYDPEPSAHQETPGEIARIMDASALLDETGRRRGTLWDVYADAPWAFRLSRIDKVSLADIVRRVRRILLEGDRAGDEPALLAAQWDDIMAEWKLKPWSGKKQDWRPGPRRPRRRSPP